jgi:hypothetical protein
MPSAFRIDKDGVPIIDADPDSELDYSITSWLEGLLFTGVDWELSPEVADVPYNDSINADAVTIDGVEYAAGEVATVWLKDLSAGQTYTLRCRATFTGSRIDDRTIKIRCRER